MPAKCVPNGFYMFMLAERNRIKEETKVAPSMQNIAAQCAESWKNLSPAEKARYNELAKEEKLKKKNDPNRDKYRMDNRGHIIAGRLDPVFEDKKRRNQEVQTLMKSWDRQDILDIRFHLINFQVMYVEEPVDYYLPMEVGMVAFTLREGLIKHMHHFIDPGDAPQGYRHLAMKHSEDTHKIPLLFEKGDDNFLSLWKQIETFVLEDSQKDEILPLFCLIDQRKCVESCLEYIHYQSCTRESNKLTKVYTLEDLVMSLIMQTGKTERKPAERQITDSLLRNQWDYIGSIRCAYHDELDCSFCSLAFVRRFSFAVFDLLADLLNFKLTCHHMPSEISNTSFTVMHPTTVNTGYSDKCNRRFSRTSFKKDEPCTSAMRTSTPPTPVPSVSRSTSPDSVSVGATGRPTLSRVEVSLSDDDSDSDNEALHTDVVKSTSDQYNLKELRKPNIPSMVLPPAVSTMITSFRRGVSRPGNTARSPVDAMVMKQGVSLSDVDSDHETLRPDVVRSVSGQNSLQQLRNPNTFPIVLPQAVSNMITSSRKGVNPPPGNRAFPGSDGQGMSKYTLPIRPPPWLGQVTSASRVNSGDVPGLNSRSRPVLASSLRSTVLSARGQGLAGVRCRGMPPQLHLFQRPE